VKHDTLSDVDKLFSSSAMTATTSSTCKTADYRNTLDCGGSRDVYEADRGNEAQKNCEREL